MACLIDFACFFLALLHLRTIACFFFAMVTSFPLFLSRFYSYLHQRTNAYQKFEIPQFVDSSSQNPIYPKVLWYVNSLESVEASCGATIIGTSNNKFKFHLQPSANEYVGDEFDGAEIYWTYVPGCLHMHIKHTDRCRMLGLYLQHIQFLYGESLESSDNILEDAPEAPLGENILEDAPEARLGENILEEAPGLEARLGENILEDGREAALGENILAEVVSAFAVSSSFRKYLEEDEDDEVGNKEETVPASISVKALVHKLQERIDRKRNREKEKHFVIPSGERKVVIYTTSLRGIRRTFDECQLVKDTLHGYKLKIDERDVSMHMAYKEELGQLIHIALPSVFANGVYIGGAEEVRRMHEAGELDNVFQECEKLQVQNGGGGDCQICAGYRFLPCQHCSGAHKVFVQHGENGAGFQPCTLCNENGLVRCSLCL